MYVSIHTYRIAGAVRRAHEFEERGETGAREYCESVRDIDNVIVCTIPSGHKHTG